MLRVSEKISISLASAYVSDEKTLEKAEKVVWPLGRKFASVGWSIEQSRPDCLMRFSCKFRHILLQSHLLTTWTWAFEFAVGSRRSKNFQNFYFKSKWNRQADMTSRHSGKSSCIHRRSQIDCWFHHIQTKSTSRTGWIFHSKQIAQRICCSFHNWVVRDIQLRIHSKVLGKICDQICDETYAASHLSQLRDKNSELRTVEMQWASWWFDFWLEMKFASQFIRKTAHLIKDVGWACSTFSFDLATMKLTHEWMYLNVLEDCSCLRNDASLISETDSRCVTKSSQSSEDLRSRSETPGDCACTSWIHEVSQYLQTISKVSCDRRKTLSPARSFIS